MKHPFPIGTKVILDKKARMNTTDIPANDPLWKGILTITGYDGSWYNIRLASGEVLDGFYTGRFILAPTSIKSKKITI